MQQEMYSTATFKMALHGPATAPVEDHECVYENGDGICRGCQAVADAETAAQTDKRAAFEAWTKPRGYDLTRCSPVAYAAYKSDFTNGALAGWLGALETLPPLSTETVDNSVQRASNAERARGSK